ncbi:MAG: hypothetical protein JNL47_11425 [Bacteroidia bacterium]|nr:hypothetical protein [Bacteroidia bacterium]
MIRAILLCLATLLIFQNGKAQNPLIAYAAASFNDGVLISFTMRGGFSCNGINIERSDDSLSFSVIGDIEGICGNPDFDVPFTFTDPEPLPNRKNFYRLDMKQLGYSPVISVYFTKPYADGTLIFPNPCIERCSLYFENTKREKIVAELLYNGNKTSAHITDQNVVELDLRQYAAGIFFCRLRYPDGTALIKKIVLVKP